MQAALKMERSPMRRCLLAGMAAWLAAATPAAAVIAYVSNEKSNTVSVIDTESWTVTKTIKVGQRPRGIEFTRDGKFVMVAVGVGMTKDDKTAFVALGPANRVAVVDSATRKVTKYLLVGQRVWHMAFTPD